MLKLYKRATALEDILRHSAYLTEEGGQTLAERFLTMSEQTFEDLLRQPLIGSPLPLREPDVAALRKWRVREFERALIFYQAHDRGVTIVRVLQATQDWWKILALD